jgi:enoyl-CoA hydratase/carnithine racemase
MSNYGDVSVEVKAHVATVQLHRPPHNFFDHQLLKDLADAFEALDRDLACRALVLASEGKSFCAGADFKQRASARASGADSVGASGIYREAVRLFACEKPVVAAIHGAAVGGGLGLALVADFRLVSPEARFAANFVRLGIHPGFGLSYTLPRLIGIQRASLMFFTGRRIRAEEAVAWGLADELVAAHELQQRGIQLAAEIAECAPLAVVSTRKTLRRGLADQVKAQTDHEFAEQSWLMQTQDHREGVRAVEERRAGRFVGR